MPIKYPFEISIADLHTYINFSLSLKGLNSNANFPNSSRLHCPTLFGNPNASLTFKLIS